MSMGLRDHQEKRRLSAYDETVTADEGRAMSCALVRRALAVSTMLAATVVSAAVPDHTSANVQLPPPNLEREAQRKAAANGQPATAKAANCASLHQALPAATGDDLVALLQSADFGCISVLERVDDAQLQYAIAKEARVLDVAHAFPAIVDGYDGTGKARLRNLMRFLIVVEDIHLWCIQRGPASGGTCRDEVWQSSERWDTAPGSAVHQAVADAVEAVRLSPHFGDPHDEHGSNLIELTRLIRDYGQSADHLEIVVWWLTHWGELYRSETFEDVMHAMFDMLRTGHRQANRPRFGPAFGEHRELLDSLHARALESSLLGTGWQFIATRSAIEIGRFSLYPETTNYVRVRDAVDSIREAYLDDEAMKPVFLRVIAELDYHDAQNCTHYKTCGWYAGAGFNANFRHEVFTATLECPASYCPDDRVTIHAQGFDDGQLALACERLDRVAERFHPLFDTGCRPVAYDFNNHLDAYVFHDISSCEDYSSAAFFRNADTCSGIYYEWNPADRSTRPYFVATEYEAWENPPDPVLSIWNFEHEYVHYLDGRYNRFDGYRGDIDSIHWWSEGIAEYVAALVLPYKGPPSFESPYSLAEILLHSDSLRTRYRYRHLAVRFFMENHRSFVDIVVGHLRRGEFEEYRAFLEGEVEFYSDAWQTWLRTGGTTVLPVDREGPYLLVPLFPEHSEGGREGFVRVVNLSDRGGDVDIVAVDDDGNRFEPTTLSLGAREAVQFNSADLENGNAAKGLPQGVGPGRGDWRLELSSALRMLVLGYIRAADGFVAPMSAVAPPYRGGYLVPTFNPGRNTTQRSLLRIGNLGDADAEVTISGVDDEGMDSWEIEMRIGGFAATTLDAARLEAGATGFDGYLGRGVGKWRLFVSSTEPIFVMSLLEAPTGHLANLSALPPDHDVDDEARDSVPAAGATD
ncbi:MAG: hypothetical protein F4029_06180 [Gammaproteobacteria bacterium]|nr:hypothetical protein [Gammaproteobacteria bacterium]MYK45798.1 hypothetical protein [Gammaproteobacteria bacterium]